ncbi:hypothetical protein OHR68_19895 [Spirillospora sp. NBC_00431]
MPATVMPQTPTMPISPVRRLIYGIEHATALSTGGTASQTSALTAAAFTDPAALTTAISQNTGGARAVVTGTLDRHLVLIEHRPGPTPGPPWTCPDNRTGPATGRHGPPGG